LNGIENEEARRICRSELVERALGRGRDEENPLRGFSLGGAFELRIGDVSYFASSGDESASQTLSARGR
jgi:hypothetical protein